jgi:hypothetical protein
LPTGPWTTLRVAHSPHSPDGDDRKVAKSFGPGFGEEREFSTDSSISPGHVTSPGCASWMDVLVQNTASGDLHQWDISCGALWSNEHLGTPPLSWAIKGTGDFNGDGEGDILWRHTSGQVAIWFMVGATRVGEAYPGGTDPSGIFSIQGVGDFNGDGRADILWRDTGGYLAIWFEGNNYNAAYPSFRNVPGPVDLSWQVNGIGDFDGDRHADILWRHTDGQVAIWYMSDGRFISDGYPGGRDPSGIFSIQGIGDFDGDGRSDILWRDTSGYLAIWSHGDRYSDTYPSYYNTGDPVDLSWSISTIGNFNLDAHSDILWTHSSGAVAVWFMANGGFFSDANITTLASGWQVKAARWRAVIF